MQEALTAAALEWPRTGVPENPRAWLIQVAARKLTDQFRSESARRRRETKIVLETPPEENVVLAPDEAPGEEDDTLVLLFMCCHPVLTRPSAIALTLRAVGGASRASFTSSISSSTRDTPRAQVRRTSGWISRMKRFASRARCTRSSRTAAK